jgi:hypothetical protein
MPRTRCGTYAGTPPCRAALLTLLLTSTACSEAPKPAPSEPLPAPGAADKLPTSTTPAAARPAARPAGQTLKLGPTALGTHAAQVTANGTGCASGNVGAEVSADGKTFTLSFPDYVAEVDAQRGLGVKDCQVALQLQSDRKVSYALASLSLTGQAQLADGSDAKLMASHYHQGSPPGDTSAEKALPGPSNEAFALDDVIDDARRSWSACGVQRDLNVVTRVRLKRGSQAGAGHVRPSKLVLTVAERACD